MTGNDRVAVAGGEIQGQGVELDGIGAGRTRSMKRGGVAKGGGDAEAKQEGDEEDGDAVVAGRNTDNARNGTSDHDLRQRNPRRLDIEMQYSKFRTSVLPRKVMIPNVTE